MVVTRGSQLLAAAEVGNVEECRRLISEDEECAWFQDEEGVSPLMRAAEGGHVEVVEMLLEAGKMTIYPA